MVDGQGSYASTTLVVESACGGDVGVCDVECRFGVVEVERSLSLERTDDGLPS